MSTLTPQAEKIDPRIMRTRALLGQAFIESISEKGFQAVSVQDIARKAGVNRTTFYLHFADKYALLDYSISQFFREELEKQLSDADRFDADNLRRLIVTVGKFVQTANAQCAPAEPQFESLVETQVKLQVQHWLQGRLQQAEARADPKSAATAASWAIYGLALQWSHEKKRPPVEVFADRILPLIAQTLSLEQTA